MRRAFEGGKLHLTGSLARLTDPAAFTDWLDQLRQQAWVVYCKGPFAGPGQVLAYLSRYTHRVAISNDRPPPSPRAASASGGATTLTATA